VSELIKCDLCGDTSNPERSLNWREITRIGLMTITYGETVIEHVCWECWDILMAKARKAGLSGAE
jgi:hypothetical protein